VLASHEYSESRAVAENAVCHEYLGLLEYYRGNYKKAREYYKKVLDMPEPTASAVAQTLRMLTDVYVAEKKWKLAVSTAKKAEEAITKINERIELAALWRAYGQIYTHKKSTDNAREHFAKSIDLLREIGAKYELALSHFAAGQSGSFKYDKRRQHLELARMLFVEMDVPKRVEQLDEAIRSMTPDPVPDVVRITGAPAIVAHCASMKEIIAMADSVAKSDLNILLTGETGTGKDVLAHYIHHKSERTGRFVSVNAAAIPHDMVEAELFGYKKGAFTGATEDKEGLLECAHEGTFYLNEIADTPVTVQAKLLEVIETRQVQRLGENHKRSIDFRLISATNHDLDARIADGKFRSDLFYRLNEQSLTLPPLSEREDDVIHLVKHFVVDVLGENNGYSEADLSRLADIMAIFDYVGNVRELRARVRSLCVRYDGDLSAILENVQREASLSTDELVNRLLDRHDGNKARVARTLGFSHTTLQRILDKPGY